MTLKERIKAAFAKKDEAGLTAVLDELDEGKSGVTTHVHVHTRDADDDAKVRDKEDKEDEDDKDKKGREKFTDAALDARFAAQDQKIGDMAADIKTIKDAIMDAKEDKEDEEDKDTKDALPFGEEAPPGTSDRAWARTNDSAFMEESFQTTVALAEIIMPGIKIPTFDAKADRRKTYDQLCQFRRKTLDLAYNTQTEVREVMDSLLGGRDFKTYDCSGVRTMFNAVGLTMKRANAADMQRDTTDRGIGGGTGVQGKVKTPADLNKAMREYYAARH